MHIPDGFLSAPVWATLDLLSLPALGWVVRRVPPAAELQQEPEAGASLLAREFTMRDRDVPLMGVMGAFLFGAQMLNFPVGPGVSTHLTGGALLGAVLGAGPAMVVMSAVLILQALVFQDGGILALGANLFNMAIAGVAIGALPRLIMGRTRTALFLGGLFSVVSTAALSVTELYLSGIAIPASLITWLAGIFLACGIAEGAITVGVTQAIDRLRFGHREPANEPGIPGIVKVVGGAALALGLTALLLASSDPDSLEAFASRLQIAAQAPGWVSPFAGYETGGLGEEWLRKVSAGSVGVVLAAAFSMAGVRLLRRRTSRDPQLPN